jgi:hypothetical protein
MSAADPILERLVRERLCSAGEPACAATELLGLVAAELTGLVGGRVTAAVLYGLADQAATAPGAGPAA